MIQVHQAKQGAGQTEKRSNFVAIELPVQRHSESPSHFFLKEVDGANLLKKPGAYHAKVPSKSARPRPNITEEDATDSDAENPVCETASDTIQSTMRQGSRRGVLRTSISHGRDMTSLGGIAATRPRVTVEEGVPNTHRVDFEEISSAPSSGRKASEADSPGGGHSWNILHFPEPPPSSRGHEKRISGLFMPWDQKLKQEHDFSHHLSTALQGLAQDNRGITPQSSWSSEGKGFMMKSRESSFLIEGNQSASSWSHRTRRDYLRDVYGLSPRAVVYGSSVGALPGFPAAPTTGSFTPYHARAPRPITHHVRNSIASMNGRGFAPMEPEAALRTQRSRQFRQPSGIFGPKFVPERDDEEIAAVRNLPDYASTASEEDKGTLSTKARIVETPGSFSEFVGGRPWRPRLLRPIDVLEIPEDSSASTPSLNKSPKRRRRSSVLLTPRVTPRRSPQTRNRRMSIDDLAPAELRELWDLSPSTGKPSPKTSTPRSSGGNVGLPTRSSGIRTMSPEGEGSQAPGKFDLIAKHGLLNMQTRQVRQTALQLES